MFQNRPERIHVALDVTVETVLQSNPGKITDISSGGAKISCSPFPLGERVKITIGNAAVWGRVRWTEEDRMGVEFETPVPLAIAVLLRSRRPANDRSRPAFGRKVV